MLHNYRKFQDKAADASLLHWEQSINPHQIVKNVQYFDILRSYLRLAPMRILAFLVSSSRSLHRNYEIPPPFPLSPGQFDPLSSAQLGKPLVFMKMYDFSALSIPAGICQAPVI